MRLCMSEILDFFKSAIGSSKFLQLTILRCVKCSLINYNTLTTQHCLSCIEAARAITSMNELLMFAHNLLVSCLRQDTSCQ